MNSIQFHLCLFVAEAEWGGGTGPPQPHAGCGSPPAAVLPFSAPLPS